MGESLFYKITLRNINLTYLPTSEQTMAEKVDAAMLPRLVKACSSNGILFAPKVVKPLLLNTYTKTELQNLISKTQIE